MEFRNDKGELISGITIARKNEYVMSIDRMGKPIIDWDTYAIHSDPDGFDITKKDSKGKYRIRYVLPHGTHIIRYGHEGGSFTAPEGTRYDEISLPYIQDTCPFNEYVVVADGLEVTCEVDKGIVAPNFETVGGGIQYKHDRSIAEERSLKNLDVVEWWKNE